MRARLLLLMVLATTAAWGQSMFQLPQGAWTYRENKTHVLVLDIGDFKSRSMELRYEEHSKDSNAVYARGTYTVTATKMGDFHTTFDVQEIGYSGFHSGGRKAESVNILGATFHKGESIRTSMAVQRDGTAQFTVFDKDIKPVLTRVLSPPERE